MSHGKSPISVTSHPAQSAAWTANSIPKNPWFYLQYWKLLMVLLLQLNGYFITPDSSTAIGAPLHNWTCFLFDTASIACWGIPHPFRFVASRGFTVGSPRSRKIGMDQDEAAKRLEVRPVAEVGCVRGLQLRSHCPLWNHHLEVCSSVT